MVMPKLLPTHLIVSQNDTLALPLSRGVFILAANKLISLKLTII